MKRPKKSIPRRISGYFDQHVSEAHVEAICSYAKITTEEFRANIGAARDIKRGPGFRLTPIYAKTGAANPGWWTRRPTEHIMAWANYEELARDIGAWERNLRVQSGTKFQAGMEGLRRNLKFQIADMMEQHSAEFGISPDLDYVVVAVNEAVEADELSIPLDGGLEEAA